MLAGPRTFGGELQARKAVAVQYESKFCTSFDLQSCYNYLAKYPDSETYTQLRSI